MLINVNDGQTGTFGQYPVAKPNGITDEVFARTFQAVTDYNIHQNKLVMVNRYRDVIKIYDLSSRTLDTVVSPNNGKYEPTVTPEDKVIFSVGDDVKNAFIGVTTTDDRIYALYSGLSEEENPGFSGYGHTIFVLDWEGNILNQYKLDKYVLDIAYDAEHHRFLATRIEPTPDILYFMLDS